ncbi:unnamed protein product [Ilex paraguariensis]|uniref:Alcohol dehydrogenase-like N-terminal domain-containing protein n=1 Tax=Ilex paraguariensis TaxID=185542 RepID=A0ABC8SSN6_9AQUA
MAKSPEEQHPVKAFGWAARDTSGVLSPFKFSRRATGDEDVHEIVGEVTEVGSKCRHEIVGVVTEVGGKVKKFKVGVGCIVGSCHSRDNCANDLENYCPKFILTYNSIYYDGTPTYGGYSDILVVNEHFVVRWPENLPLDAGAPLLCAGITTYSPLKYYGLDKPGMHVGVVGLGGLGHVGVKFAKALGVKVAVISTSPSKKEEASEHFGADSFLVSRDPDQMQVAVISTSPSNKEEAIEHLGADSFLAAMGTMDGIIDTVSAVHPLLPLLERKLVAGSGIGGMKETQEMIDFAAEHNITVDIEVIPMDYVNTAMERLVKADVRYQFGIDVGNTLKAA